MALRLMEIVLPAAADVDVASLLDGRSPHGVFARDEGERRILHLVLPADAAEQVMDNLEQRFAGHEGFCVVLLPVEAMLPHPEPEPEADTEEVPETTEQVGRVSREELYAEVLDGLGTSRSFLVMVILSTLVAAVGLRRNDLAVIVGAMVIAPLLAPNVALALATTLADLGLARKALRTGLTGLGTALLLAVCMGLLLPVDPSVPAIAARTHPGASDFALALVAGAAGTFAVTSGLSGAVIGVMVAVALMPPLVACGMLLGSGYVQLALGAFLLTAANLISVNLAGVATFLIQGVSPRRWWQAAQARRATLTAAVMWTLLLAALAGIVWWTRKG